VIRSRSHSRSGGKVGARILDVFLKEKCMSAGYECSQVQFTLPDGGRWNGCMCCQGENGCNMD
jgi:hypothetical protein